MLKSWLQAWVRSQSMPSSSNVTDMLETYSPVKINNPFCACLSRLLSKCVSLEVVKNLMPVQRSACQWYSRYTTPIAYSHLHRIPKYRPKWSVSSHRLARCRHVDPIGSIERSRLILSDRRSAHTSKTLSPPSFPALPLGIRLVSIIEGDKDEIYCYFLQ